MRIFKGAIAGAIVIALSAVMPASPANAAPPTAPYTAWTLAGSYNAVATAENASITLTTSGEGFNIFASMNNGEWYSGSVAAPTGQVLTPGRFLTKRSADATHAGLDVGGNGGGCSEVDGIITIHEVTREAGTNKILSIAVTFEQTTCLPVHGEIRWNSPQGYAAGFSVPRMFGFGEVAAGRTSAFQTITIRSLGSIALTLGPATISGQTPSFFVIGNDTCSNATLAYDQTCTIAVAARPDALGFRTAVLGIATNAGGEGFNLNATGIKSTKGMYQALTPSRILDTRNGNGAPTGPVAPGGTIDLQVTGRGGVPSANVLAVVLNVTVTSPTTSGHITVWPAGVAKPTASSLNFVPGWTGANSVTVAVGSGGRVSLFNSDGHTHLIADVVGYYTGEGSSSFGSGLLHSFEPARLLDTRDPASWPFGKLDSGDVVWMFLDFPDGNHHIKAWAVNITATEPGAAGFLTAWNGDVNTPLPLASTLNYAPGQTVPNLAIVPTKICTWECEDLNLSMIGIYTNAPTHVIVDIVGIMDDGTFTGGLRLEPMTPTRIVDTRIGQGHPGALPAGSTATITPPGGILVENTQALALNLTAVAPTMPTFMTVWPTGLDRPFASNLNPSAGQTIPNAVITGLGSGGAFNVYNNGGSVDFIVDVVGCFYWYPFGEAMAANGSRPARPPGKSFIKLGAHSSTLHR